MNSDQAYQILDLNDTATIDMIKEAYRKLALESHPDKNTNEKDGSKFKKVTEAYHVLKDHHDNKNKKSKKGHHHKQTTASPKSQWGAPRPPKPPSSNGEPPQQDWSKFTQEYEQADPTWWKEYEREFWEQYNKNVTGNGGNGDNTTANTEHDKTKEPKVQPDLFIHVDQSMCIGCCSCEIIAPDVFHIDRKVQTNPKSKVINMKGAGVNKIMNAAETCPTKAINVENKNTKERLFPH